MKKHSNRKLCWLAGLAATGLLACGNQPEPNTQASAQQAQPQTAQQPSPQTYASPEKYPSAQYPETPSNGAGASNTGSSYGANGATNAQAAEPGGLPTAVSPVGTYGGMRSGSNGSATGAISPPPSDAELGRLNEAQIAAVVEALNDGEIRVADMAEATTSNAEVRRFAHEIATDHQAMLSKDKGLWSRLKVEPAANPISGQIDSDTQSDVTHLTAAQGDQFDREFVDLQVDAHQRAVDLVTRLLPNVKNAAVRAELEAAKPKLEMHLRMAKNLKDSMKKGVTERQPSPSSPPADQPDPTQRY